MVGWSRRVAESRRFQAVIVAIILVNAVLVGLETSEDLIDRVGGVFALLNFVVAAIFVVEIAIRLVAYWPRPVDFFRDPWNVFDFVIVALVLLPSGGSFATVARLARLLRVVRLVSAFPELRLIVGTMLRSFSSMGGVVLLLALVMYVYGVLGYHLFHVIDPARWGDLGTSLKTLFETLTLEGWLEAQAGVLAQAPYAWLFFGTYILLAVFIVVNLFIAVILNNLESVKAEHVAEAADAARGGGDPVVAEDAMLLVRVETLRRDLDDLEDLLRQRADDAARRGT